ncbi:Long chain acyl-CoA synthetase 7 peroxisomal, partial [Kappamyces sp. JEL0680]
LSHSLERVFFHTLVHFGATVGFYRGDITALMDDIQTFRPTLLLVVPRLLDRIYQSIRHKLTDPSTPLLNRLAFQLAFSRKQTLLEDQGIVSSDTVWDRLVFAAIQNKLGGQVRGILTGAAPIASSTLAFLRIVLGAFIIEGYGLTETCAGGMLTQWGDHHPPYGSHVGVPFSSCEYKLADAAELNYLVTDIPNPRGEICIRGPIVMKGYYKDPEQTRQTIDADGWLHTGDVGEILPNHTLRIIDRLNSVFKLSQGKFVAAEQVESKLHHPALQQLFVYGDSLHAHVVALASVDADGFRAWCNKQGLRDASVAELCEDPAVRSALLDELAAAGKKNGLHGFEIPKAIHIVTEA